jgi:uncharacterized protein (TIGR02145 family)
MKKKLKSDFRLTAISFLIIVLSVSCNKKSNDNNDTGINIIPLETGSVTDIEGNVYKTVKIGSQWWMAENLKTTRFNYGSAILMVADSNAWFMQIGPAYCWYDNDSMTNKNIYGALYNSYAVKTGKLSPAGWHIPTESDWTTLTTYLGNHYVAGGKMKESGYVHWVAPNTGATNESGFTALPGGYRASGGRFRHINSEASFATAFEGPYGGSSYFRDLTCNSNYLEQFYNGSGSNGFSVRCVKD